MRRRQKKKKKKKKRERATLAWWFIRWLCNRARGIHFLSSTYWLVKCFMYGQISPLVLFCFFFLPLFPLSTGIPEIPKRRLFFFFLFYTENRQKKKTPKEKKNQLIDPLFIIVPAYIRAISHSDSCVSLVTTKIKWLKSYNHNNKKGKINSTISYWKISMISVYWRGGGGLYKQGAIRPFFFLFFPLLLVSLSNGEREKRRSRGTQKHDEDPPLFFDNRLLLMADDKWSCCCCCRGAVWDIVKKPTQQRGHQHKRRFSKEKKKKVTRKSDLGTRSANKSVEKKKKRRNVTFLFDRKFRPLFLSGR